MINKNVFSSLILLTLFLGSNAYSLSGNSSQPKEHATSTSPKSERYAIKAVIKISSGCMLLIESIPKTWNFFSNKNHRSKKFLVTHYKDGTSEILIPSAFNTLLTGVLLFTGILLLYEGIKNARKGMAIKTSELDIENN